MISPSTRGHALLFVAATLAAPVFARQDAAPAPEAGVIAFEFAPEVFDGPFDGDLFLAFAEEGEPREAMHAWFEPPPVLRFDVEDAEGTLRLKSSDAAAHFPFEWSEIASGPWRVQAVARRNKTGREPGLDEGDVFSAAAEITYTEGSEGVITLRLDQVVSEDPFVESERVKLFTFVSPSLSEFHGFEYTLKAGVRLPRSFGERDAHPVVYSVTGFGGTHENIRGWDRRVGEDSILDDCLIVVPDATNRYGHSVFCDSRSIGPWGKALVEELIPALEKEYGGAGAAHRYTTGVSSGGWSSLWLQVAYPGAFSGCWSHVPDPIDFHDFQQIDLYTPLEDGSPRNMYVDESGARRPLARRGDDVMLYYEDFVRHEHVLNPGGQIRSFDATFSLPGPGGAPQRVFDFETGAIDHAVAQSWRPYDISHTLLTRWDELRDSLAGKLHVYAGGVDTFYLEGAVERFQGLAREAGILDQMTIEVVPGLPHTLYGPGQEAMMATIAKRWSEAADD